MSDYEALIPILAPDLIGNPGWEVALEMAEAEVNPDHCYYDRVVVLTAAHILSSGSQGGALLGAVKSQSEGGLSITYETGSSSGGSTSAYGSEVKRLNYLCYGMSARTAWLKDPGMVPVDLTVWPDKPIQVGNG